MQKTATNIPYWDWQADEGIPVVTGLGVEDLNDVEVKYWPRTGGNGAFEQPLNAQPFFLSGTWDRVDGGANAKGVTAYLLKGAGADERQQAESLIGLASDARSFYATLLGAAPEVPLRLVTVTRGAGFEGAGTVLLSEGSFNRKTIDSATAGESCPVAR